jgi:hypothetical protein
MAKLTDLTDPAAVAEAVAGFPNTSYVTLIRGES